MRSRFPAPANNDPVPMAEEMEKEYKPKGPTCRVTRDIPDVHDALFFFVPQALLRAQASSLKDLDNTTISRAVMMRIIYDFIFLSMPHAFQLGTVTEFDSKVWDKLPKHLRNPKTRMPHIGEDFNLAPNAPVPEPAAATAANLSAANMNDIVQQAATAPQDNSDDEDGVAGPSVHRNGFNDNSDDEDDEDSDMLRRMEQIMAAPTATPSASAPRAALPVPRSFPAQQQPAVQTVAGGPDDQDVANGHGRQKKGLPLCIETPLLINGEALESKVDIIIEPIFSGSIPIGMSKLKEAFQPAKKILGYCVHVLFKDRLLSPEKMVMRRSQDAADFVHKGRDVVDKAKKGGVKGGYSAHGSTASTGLSGDVAGTTANYVQDTSVIQACMNKDYIDMLIAVTNDIASRRPGEVLPHIPLPTYYKKTSVDGQVNLEAFRDWTFLSTIFKHMGVAESQYKTLRRQPTGYNIPAYDTGAFVVPVSAHKKAAEFIFPHKVVVSMRGAQESGLLVKDIQNVFDASVSSFMSVLAGVGQVMTVHNGTPAYLWTDPERISDRNMVAVRSAKEAIIQAIASGDAEELTKAQLRFREVSNSIASELEVVAETTGIITYKHANVHIIQSVADNIPFAANIPIALGRGMVGQFLAYINMSLGNIGVYTNHLLVLRLYIHALCPIVHSLHCGFPEPGTHSRLVGPPGFGKTAVIAFLESMLCPFTFKSVTTATAKALLNIDPRNDFAAVLMRESSRIFTADPNLLKGDEAILFNIILTLLTDRRLTYEKMERESRDQPNQVVDNDKILRTVYIMPDNVIVAGDNMDSNPMNTRLMQVVTTFVIPTRQMPPPPPMNITENPAGAAFSVRMRILHAVYIIVWMNFIEQGLMPIPPTALYDTLQNRLLGGSLFKFGNNRTPLAMRVAYQCLVVMSAVSHLLGPLSPLIKYGLKKAAHPPTDEEMNDPTYWNDRVEMVCSQFTTEVIPYIAHLVGDNKEAAVYTLSNNLPDLVVCIRLSRILGADLGFGASLVRRCTQLYDRFMVDKGIRLDVPSSQTEHPSAYILSLEGMKRFDRFRVYFFSESDGPEGAFFEKTAAERRSDSSMASEESDLPPPPSSPMRQAAEDVSNQQLLMKFISVLGATLNFTEDRLRAYTRRLSRKNDQNSDTRTGASASKQLTDYLAQLSTLAAEVQAMGVSTITEEVRDLDKIGKAARLSLMIEVANEPAGHVMTSVRILSHLMWVLGKIRHSTELYYNSIGMFIALPGEETALPMEPRAAHHAGRRYGDMSQVDNFGLPLSLDQKIPAPEFKVMPPCPFALAGSIESGEHYDPNYIRIVYQAGLTSLVNILLTMIPQNHPLKKIQPNELTYYVKTVFKIAQFQHPDLPRIKYKPATARALGKLFDRIEMSKCKTKKSPLLVFEGDKDVAINKKSKLSDYKDRFDKQRAELERMNAERHRSDLPPLGEDDEDDEEEEEEEEEAAASKEGPPAKKGKKGKSSYRVAYVLSHWILNDQDALKDQFMSLLGTQFTQEGPEMLIGIPCETDVRYMASASVLKGEAPTEVINSQYVNPVMQQIMSTQAMKIDTPQGMAESNPKARVYFTEKTNRPSFNSNGQDEQTMYYRQFMKDNGFTDESCMPYNVAAAYAEFAATHPAARVVDFPSQLVAY